MAGTANPGYGTPNWEMLQRWLALPAEDDGPFWALNLMKYRAVAAYADGHGDAPRVGQGRRRRVRAARAARRDRRDGRVPR